MAGSGREGEVVPRGCAAPSPWAGVVCCRCIQRDAEPSAGCRGSSAPTERTGPPGRDAAHRGIHTHRVARELRRDRAGCSASWSRSRRP